MRYAGMSPGQKQVYNFIKAYTTGHGYPPTFREICSHIGAVSTNSAADHLRALERKGYLLRGPKCASRALRLTEKQP